MVTAAPPRFLAASRRSPVAYWHLFSLDAPTVACLWSYTFLRLIHRGDSWRAPLLLALATWTLYVADRILDGLRQPMWALRERHFFHAQHRRALTILTLAIGMAAAWLAFTTLDRETLREALVVLAEVSGYFALVHSQTAWMERLFPKEAVVGLVFASATAVPAWSALAAQPRERYHLLPLIALFAALCWLNCAAIEKWEQRAPGHRPATGGYKLRPSGNVGNAASALIAAAAAGLLIAGHVAGRLESGSGAVCLCIALSAAILWALDHGRERLSPMHLRLAADAALLTPLLFLTFMGR